MRLAAGQTPDAFSCVQPSTTRTAVGDCPSCTQGEPKRVPNEPTPGVKGATSRCVTRPRTCANVVRDTHWYPFMSIGVAVRPSSVPLFTIVPPFTYFVVKPVVGATVA